jgi:2,3-bisphosphoglycerate-independent phosphoglycerate mutase
MPTKAAGPLVLIIRDGWGMNPNPSHAPFDAIRVAQSRGLTPVADALIREYPWTLIKTSGEDVGLPGGGDDGELPTMGNSEVGHQNIGAGRVVYQESVAISLECRKGLEKNTEIAAAITRAKQNGKAVHLLGIASDAGVHGLLTHLYAVLKACKALGQTAVYLHLFTDGRDTGPFTGKEFVAQVEREAKAIGVGTVASISGRYYAMDRDYRWERVRLAYDVMTGKDTGAKRFPTAAAAIQDYYDHPTNDSQKGDEFIPPRMIEGGAPIQDGDSVIFYNYRGDRPREISAAFVFPDAQWSKVKPSPDSGKNGFDRGSKLNLHYVIMTEYWDELLPHVKVAFPKPPKMVNIMGEYLSKLGLTQFRCAETEKYPHVTFFFNDYRDPPFPGETRENPQSPKVATYDLKPEMSASEVRDAVLRRLAAPNEGPGRCEDFIVVNFANGDMVGHTGKLEAAVTAVATVDACVGAIVDATLAKGGRLIVTADHGNCEQMYDPETKAPHTAHTIYDVPLIVVDPALKGHRLHGDQNVAGWFDPKVRANRGRLADIAPTALSLMGLEKPQEMLGRSLIS